MRDANSTPLAMEINGFDYRQKRKAHVSNNNVSVCYWKEDAVEEDNEMESGN